MVSLTKSVLIDDFCLKKVLSVDLQWIGKQCIFFLLKEHCGEMFWSG